MLRRSCAPALVASIAFTVVLGACSGSTRATAHPTTKGPDPNAPEVVAPGDIPDTQVFVPYVGAGFRMTVPEGWPRTDTGTATTFTDHYNTIAVTTAPAPTAPTVGSVRDAVVPTLRTDVPSFALAGVTTVQRTAGPAVLVTYRAGSDPNPVTGKRVAVDVERYEFWRNGTQVTITLTGAHGSDNVDPWKTITNSFAWSS